MGILSTLTAYPRSPEPRVAAANRLALAVAASQPTYPLYLGWLVGGPWAWSWWTLLSTPMFLGVPWLARRDPQLGRALLVLAGLGNTALALKLFGPQAGLGWFIPACAGIAVLAFGPGERRWTMALVALCAALALGQGHLGAPLAQSAPAELAALARLNFGSGVALGAIVLFSFGVLPTSPPWR